MSAITANGFIGHLDRGAAPRELELLPAIANGMSSKEATRGMCTAAGTIDKRLFALTTKLDVARGSALVGEAFRRSIIAPALCMVLALLVGVEHQQAAVNRRLEGLRRAEMRVTARRGDATDWVA